MQLLTLHKILVSVAITGAAAFAGYEVWLWRWTHAPVALVFAGAAVGVAGALALYLRRVIKRGIVLPGR